MVCNVIAILKMPMAPLKIPLLMFVCKGDWLEALSTLPFPGSNQKEGCCYLGNEQNDEKQMHMDTAHLLSAEVKVGNARPLPGSDWKEGCCCPGLQTKSNNTEGVCFWSFWLCKHLNLKQHGFGGQGSFVSVKSWIFNAILGIQRNNLQQQFLCMFLSWEFCYSHTYGNFHTLSHC